MPVIQFKGKTAIESYHHTIPHHTLEFNQKLSLLPKGEKPSLEGNLIIEGDNLLALKAADDARRTHKMQLTSVLPFTPATKAGFTTRISGSRAREWVGKTICKEWVLLPSIDFGPRAHATTSVRSNRLQER